MRGEAAVTLLLIVLLACGLAAVGYGAVALFTRRGRS